MPSEVWRRDEQIHDLRTELSLHALHSEDVTQQQKSKICWTTSAIDRFGFKKHSNIERCLKNLELLNRLLDQTLIDFDEEEELFRSVRQQKNERAKFEARSLRNRADMEPPIHDIWRPAINFVNYTAKSCNCRHQLFKRICDAAHFTSSEGMDFDEFYELHQWSFHCHHDVLDEEDDERHF